MLMYVPIVYGFLPEINVFVYHDWWRLVLELHANIFSTQPIMHIRYLVGHWDVKKYYFDLRRTIVTIFNNHSRISTIHSREVLTMDRCMYLPEQFLPFMSSL